MDADEIRTLLGDNIFERAKPKGVYDDYTEEELRDIMEIEARVNADRT